MKPFFYPCLYFFLLIAGMPQTFSAHLTNSLQFTARLSGANEVPAISTDAQGVGIFTLSADRTAMAVNISVNGLSGDITGIHIHEGAPGENGDVVIDLTPFVNGNRIKTTLRNISSETLAKFLTGAYYLNVHTEANGGGEIRGQVLLETDLRYTAILSGDQEVPAVTTDAFGLGVFNLAQSGYKLQLRVVVQGLSGPITGAHLHNEAIGMNGGVVEDLTTSVVGNVIEATVDPTAYLSELIAGNIYINVHTAANVDGEIRGQLMLKEELFFDSWLDGAQEVPAVLTTAKGVATIGVSPDLSDLNYHIVVDGLSGDITGAHFHAAAPGVNGGVVVDLSDGIDGTKIMGTVEDISPELLNLMLTGGIYINVHTEANPGGEIRGQVYRLAREGYSYDFSGGQEVPPTTSAGTGAGMVSIDRDQTNAHFMMVVSGLADPINAAHFHNERPGENGGVIFPLTGFFNNGGAFGHWTENDEPAFAHSPLFRNNEVYVNIHTSTFPAGAIRANITRGGLFFAALPDDPGFSPDLLITARLNGDNEVPVVVTDAVGIGSFMVNGTRDSIEVNVSVSGLSGPITGIHIHEGAPGENGGVIFNFTDFVAGNRVTTTLTDFDTTQLAKFLTGDYYLNVHTEDNPGGEIRGQLMLEKDVTLRADLDGSQEEPPVPVPAVGLATFNYTNVLNTLDVNVIVNGLSGPITGAHLHEGAVGVNGDVVQDLTDLVNGNTIMGTVMPGDYLQDLMDGNLYINIHTEAYPGGEIRGQVRVDTNLTFDTWLMGAQEVPPATTPAIGLAAVTLSPTFDEIKYRIITDDLSGPATGAHFHIGTLGQNGPVIQSFTDSINGNEISGSISGMDVSINLVNQMLSGDIYINVHTAAFPGGEIRGQLYRLARDGYAYDICPGQETGTVDAPNATGAGITSFDRNLSNAHIMVVTSGLTGDITGAHIHEGEPGVSGGVIYPLTDLFSDGAMFAYISEDDEDQPLTKDIVRTIQSGNAYVNIHTEMHPGGEIRGQIIRSLECPFTTATEEVAEETFNSIQLFPNPAINELYVNFNNRDNEQITIKVFDLTGRILHTAFSDQTFGNILINTSRLPAGMYYLKMEIDAFSTTKKFVKTN